MDIVINNEVQKRMLEERLLGKSISEIRYEWIGYIMQYEGLLK